MEGHCARRCSFALVLTAFLFGCIIPGTKSFRYVAIYDGSSEVEEGFPFQISCNITKRDFPKWTMNGEEIHEDNDFGYTLERRKRGAFGIEMVLQASSAQAYHHGEYRCNAYSRDFHFLKVLSQGNEDEEYDGDMDTKEEERAEKVHNDVILQINETITLECKSAKDDDTPLIWYRNSKRILEGNHPNLNFIGRNLIIHKTTESDAGEYMCMVEGSSQPGRADIGRILNVKSPAHIVHFPRYVNAIRGKSVTLHCKVSGFPIPRITWYIGNEDAEDLKKTDPRISIYSEDQRNYFLTVEKASLTDRGLYTCRAYNSVYEKTLEKDEVSVFVQVRDIASSALSSSAIYVRAGGNFTLACRVPLSGIHLWYKDNKPIQPNSINRFYLEQDPPEFSPDGNFIAMKLTVKEAAAIHTGLYKCNNIVQKVVVVTENMIQTNEDVPGVGKILIPGEQLVLHCNITECPHCRVLWYKDGAKLLAPGDHIQIFDNNTVIINQASYNDSGMYVCAIDREQLDVALNASISVLSEVKLEKFESTSLVFVQGSPLELLCIAKGAPLPEIKWYKGNDEIARSNPRIKLYEHNEHNGLKEAKLWIEEAEFEDRDHYTCEAYNKVNSANVTTFIRIKDKLAALWPFLGICAEVAILCSIIFVYEKRKSKTQFDEGDTDHPIENKHLKDKNSKVQDVRQRK